MATVLKKIQDMYKIITFRFNSSPLISTKTRYNNRFLTMFHNVVSFFAYRFFLFINHVVSFGEEMQ